MCVDEHGCWAWTGVKNAAGYGTLMVEDDSIPSGGKPMLAHRLSYLIFVGQIARAKLSGISAISPIVSIRRISLLGRPQKTWLTRCGLAVGAAAMSKECVMATRR